MALNRRSIAEALRALGLKTGDKVLVHSSFLSLGEVEGGPAAVIDGFLDALGDAGTLLVPVFGALGVLTEEVKHRPGAVISPSPVGTLAALGPDAEELCRDHWKADTAHGRNTPFTRLAERDGYICLLGVDHDRNTTLHTAEALLELPYLRDTTATFTTPDGQEITKTWKFYPGPHRDFIGLGPQLESVTRRGRIGNAEVRLLKARDMLDAAMAAGRKDPAFVLCDNPACADCVSQRAAILRDRFDRRESFQLAASSRLAGRYVPEMIENLRDCGLHLLELDFIQGQPWWRWEIEQLKRWLAELAAAGIAVSAARCFTVPDDRNVAEIAAEAGITRLLLPLNNSLNAARAAAERRLATLWFNTNQPATETAIRYRELQQEIASASGMVFNPVNFVGAAEKPFLKSYRRGRFIRTLAQLDVADATWDGQPKTLARGNGEIKELISILRCRNFSGVMTLGGGAVYPGSLREATADFVRLLDNM